MARPTRESMKPNPVAVGTAGLLRRMTVAKTEDVLWHLAGVEDDDGNVEAFTAEPIGWLGLATRPKAGARVEAVVVAAGGNSNTRYVVAARDQDLAAALAVALDQTVLHNSVSRVDIKPDGTIEARSHAGAAVALATKADVQALRDWAAGQLYGGTGSAPPPIPPPTPAGTTKLKGE